VFIRRKPKENNFKAVLETIRDLMNINCVVPDWLHDIILGYGDPGSAHYSRYNIYEFSSKVRTSVMLSKLIQSMKTSMQQPKTITLCLIGVYHVQARVERIELLTGAA